MRSESPPPPQPVTSLYSRSSLFTYLFSGTSINATSDSSRRRCANLIEVRCFGAASRTFKRVCPQQCGNFVLLYTIMSRNRMDIQGVNKHRIFGFQLLEMCVVDNA